VRASVSVKELVWGRAAISYEPREKTMRVRPQRYQCPKCRWDFAFRKKRCCPGCGTLLLIASDNPTDPELTAIKSFWMWEPVEEKWDYIRDWEKHKREAMRRFEQVVAYGLGQS